MVSLSPCLLVSLSLQSASLSAEKAMPSPRKLLAFDLGAESGRGILGLFDGQRLALDVVHRFPNRAVHTLETLHWDVLYLYGEMINAMRICAGKVGGIDSAGVDTWGVDFALLGR